MRKKILVEAGSFRDPSGFVFYKGGKVYRQINKSYRKDFQLFLDSGLYDRLKKEGLILSFKKVDKKQAMTNEAYAVLETQKIPFVSYPYEWSFSQLKDVAETTLIIQKIALDYGMSLKDASAYNIQFIEGKPKLIDLLSFERYKEGTPWVAYRQFCQHFLAPLSLASFKDVRLSQLLRIYIDGIPLDLASKLLPKKTWVSFPLLSHIHLHAKSQKYFAKVEENLKKQKKVISRKNLLSLVDHLLITVKSLRLKLKTSQWKDYYSFTNYTEGAFGEKKRLVSQFLDSLSPKTVWDLGANTGEFSQIAAKKGITTVAFDADFLAVEKNYLNVKKRKEKHILPLVVDLINPSPAIGFANQERKSLMARGPADCALVLALIHHLAIANNLPFYNIAEFLSKIANSLIIEFVPKKDSQVKKLLSTREDIFLNYNKNNFEKSFSRFFKIVAIEKISLSSRIIYCLKKK